MQMLTTEKYIASGALNLPINTSLPVLLFYGWLVLKSILGEYMKDLSMGTFWP